MTSLVSQTAWEVVACPWGVVTCPEEKKVRGVVTSLVTQTAWGVVTCPMEKTIRGVVTSLMNLQVGEL